MAYSRLAAALKGLNTGLKTGLDYRVKRKEYELAQQKERREAGEYKARQPYYTAMADYYRAGAQKRRTPTPMTGADLINRFKIGRALHDPQKETGFGWFKGSEPRERKGWEENLYRAAMSPFQVGAVRTPSSPGQASSRDDLTLMSQEELADLYDMAESEGNQELLNRLIMEADRRNAQSI